MSKPIDDSNYLNRGGGFGILSPSPTIQRLFVQRLHFEHHFGAVLSPGANSHFSRSFVTDPGKRSQRVELLIRFTFFIGFSCLFGLTQSFQMLTKGLIMRDPEWLTSESEEMASAMRAARSSFWEFAQNVELERWRIVPTIEAALIKAYIPDAGAPGMGEFHFVDDIIITKSGVIGTLNAPGHDLNGKEITVPFENVCDWLLLFHGEKLHKGGLGGFTVDVLRKTIPSDQRYEYESYPPVSWYRHRQGLTAQDELKQVPVCVQCGKRDLIDFSYRDGKCGCCVNDVKRTNCEACGILIMRAEKQPKICFACKSKIAPGAASNVDHGTSQGMSMQAKLYTFGVLGVFVIVSIVLGMMIFDPAGGQAQGRLMMLGIVGTLWVVLAATLGVNILQKRLMLFSTIFQIIALFFTCIGVPVGVFGAVAMFSERSHRKP